MALRLQPASLSDGENQLRNSVRKYLQQRLPPGSYRVGLGMNGAQDPEFSRDLGSQGWLGMTVPREYGGGDRSAVDRLIVVEELLSVGAPVGHHWVADRQSAGTILANGTEEQKREFLPRIASGELSFSIGMSEPDSGSDLASISSKAVPSNGGWLINGSKIWNSAVTGSDYMIALLRTGPERHAGLSQFIIDLKSTDGISMSSVPFVDGTRHFTVLTFDDAWVSNSALLGELGGGWSQNTSELVLERSGVDRWMSPIPILERWLQGVRDNADRDQIRFVGRVVSRCWAFHNVSLSVARMVDEGLYPRTEAALLKDMATRFEQEVITELKNAVGHPVRVDSLVEFEALLARAIQVMPSWTIRGGTTEVLHSIIAKELQKNV